MFDKTLNLYHISIVLNISLEILKSVISDMFQDYNIIQLSNNELVIKKKLSVIRLNETDDVVRYAYDSNFKSILIKNSGVVFDLDKVKVIHPNQKTQEFIDNIAAYKPTPIIFEPLYELNKPREHPSKLLKKTISYEDLTSTSKDQESHEETIEINKQELSEIAKRVMEELENNSNKIEKEENELIKTGMDHLKSKNFLDAYNNFNAALENNTENKVAWYHKGLALEHLKQKSKAIYCYDKALKIDPGYIKAKVAREKLLHT